MLRIAFAALLISGLATAGDYSVFRTQIDQCADTQCGNKIQKEITTLAINSGIQKKQTDDAWKKTNYLNNPDSWCGSTNTIDQKNCRLIEYTRNLQSIEPLR